MLLFFDCETAPQSELWLTVNGLIPEFEPPGNVKDPEKLKEREIAHRAKCVADAALSPVTGTVCAIAWQMGSVDASYEAILAKENVTEKVLLTEFWRIVRNAVNNGSKVCGFNCKKFDLPFLIRRSWVLGVEPVTLHDGKWWYDRSVVDLRDRWTFGDRYEVGSLGVLAKLFGIGEKTGDGAMFHKLMHSDEEKARAYLKNDVKLLPLLAERMEVKG